MRLARASAALAAAAAALLAVPVAGASASTGTGGAAAPSSTGGVRVGQPQQPPQQPRAAKPRKATLRANGQARAPRGAPRAVRRVIAAGNKLQGLPYRYGGGHVSFKDTAYDCSGSVSFALHGANLLSSPLDSVAFASWGAAGRGRWITVYTNPQHAYMIVAGLRLDTSGSGGTGPKWQTAKRSSSGFTARHPAGL